MVRQRIKPPPIEAPRGLTISPSAPAEILDLPEGEVVKNFGQGAWTAPEFWPEGLDPLDNQNVSLWLLGRGPWEGQKPGWKHYALDPAEAAMKPGTWAWRSKRAMDITLVLLGLPFIVPIAALAAFAVFFTIGRPIHFRQYRPGYLGEPFKMYKIRTMQKEGNTESPREDAERLTRLGYFLRTTSIDELPQIINVLKGEMSLVGPRPQLSSYTVRMDKGQRQRFGGLPGITGLAQVNGRNSLHWSRRFAFDVEYFKKRTFGFDWALLAMSVITVFSQKGSQRPTSDSESECPFFDAVESDYL